MEEVKNQNLWNFDFGSQESMNVPIWTIIGFQQRDSQGWHNLKNDIFGGFPVTSAQCIIGTGKKPDAGIFLIYDGDYSQGYGQIKEAFRALTKNDILQTYTFIDDFRSTDAGVVEIGYNLYVLDIQNHEIFTASQPIKLELNSTELFLMI